MNKVFSKDPIEQTTIDEWKGKFRNVFAVEVPVSDEPGADTITGYVRKPDLEEIGIVTSGNKENPVKAVIVLYNTCLLGGHPSFETDKDVRDAAIKQFEDILKTRQATIKKV